MLENCFYKYTTLNTNIINSILCNNIWHAEASTLNDPFELNFGFKRNMPTNMNDLAALLEQCNYFTAPKNRESEKNAFIQAFLANQHDKIHEATTTIIKNGEELFREQVKQAHPFICSMSNINHEPLMWSHYSNGMQGICIAYDKSKLEHADLTLQKTIYRPSLYDVDFIKVYLDYKRNSSNFDSTSLGKVFTNKHIRWEYEEEYRSIIWPTSDQLTLKGISHPLSDNSIKAIIYGHRISSSDLNTLKKLAELKRFPLYKASPIYSELKIDVTKMN
ncbi:hypothetical protein C0W54_21610 [Photobacterium kishitanii]|uniref:DUF2971 domain-containing protein n=1 Tax=Photobacterium kishitanii TaxID=318456 RepID=UPI000D17192A|nr:DUF2971 domain-containing protein [Photobacterium kishitanii]PSW57937.1 hypothetical protein C0W54_21610 [Photobacterium kishitanii]